MTGTRKENRMTTLRGCGRCGLFMLLALGWIGCGIGGVSTGSDDDPKREGVLQVLGLKATSITDTSAVMEWTTTMPTVSVLRIGESSDLTSSASHTTGFNTYHQLALSDLDPDTQYHYRVQAITTRGDTTSARGKAFRTDPQHGVFDATAPVISEIEVTSVTSSSALLHWRTDDQCRGLVAYGPSAALGLERFEYPGDPDKHTRGHALTLTGLEPSTTYHVVIRATNLAGLTTNSSAFTLATLQAPTLTFCPQTVSASPGVDFDVTLCIEQAQDLAGAAVTLAYDPAALQIVGGASGVDPGPFFLDNGGHLFMAPVVDTVRGRILIEASWIIDYDGDEPLGTRADGAGALCTLRCRWRSEYTGEATGIAFVLTDTDSDGEDDTRLLDFNRLPVRFDGVEALITVSR
jgi:hypothetical protein